MKIGIVCPYSFRFKGGVQNQVLYEIDFLKNNDYEVTLFAPDLDEEFAIKDVAFISLGKSIRIPGNGSKIPLSFDLSKLTAVLKFAEQCDILHFHEPFYPLTAEFLRRTKVVSIATFHAARESHPYYRWFRFYFQPLFSKLRSRIAVSKQALSTVQNHFQGEVKIIPNGIQLPQEIFTNKPGNNLTRSKSILFIGRNEKRKGLQVLLSAFSQLAEEFPEYSLHLVGDITLADILPRVKIFPRLSDLEKWQTLQNAEILVVPSTHGESFGIVLIEGMAAGAAIVATDIPAYRDLIHENQSGLLFRSADSQACADRLREIIKKPELRNQLVCSGYKQVQNFSWQSIGTKYLQEFKVAIEF